MTDFRANLSRLPDSHRYGWIVPLVLAGVSLGVFCDVLFTTSRVAGSPTADMPLQFIPWRQFGFEEMRHGNLPLWNPHVFGGTPYLAGFQSALFYPLNWLHLILPDALAINWGIIAHVFLAGWLMSIWCRSRGAGTYGQLLGGLMYMFSGPFFLHVYAGHLPHVCVMPWAPLLFLSIDRVIGGAYHSGALLMTLAATMLVLAGHPQYVYYTAIVAFVYLALSLVHCSQRRQAVLVCAGVGVLVLGLTAIQVLPGISATSEAVRAGGVKYEFARSFSFPPENLLTVVAPNVFGRVSSDPSVVQPESYFGAGYLWEMSLFVGGTGLVCAIVGFGALARPQRWVIMTAMALTAVLALGAHTPLHRLLYDYLPGFNSFRGSTKFSYLLVMFVCMLASLGIDALLLNPKARRTGFLAACTLAGTVLAIAIAIHATASDGLSGLWGRLVRNTVERSTDWNELFYNPTFLGDPGLLSRAGTSAAVALYFAVGELVLVGVVVALSKRWSRLPVLLPVIGGTTLLIFASQSRDTLPSTPAFPAEWKPMIEEARALNTRLIIPNPQYQNLGMSERFNTVWGYDPLVLKRYAQFAAASQGIDPDEASQYVQFTHAPPAAMSSLMRVSGVLLDKPKAQSIAVPGAMPVARLVSVVRVNASRDSILAALDVPGFDPSFSAIVESEPPVKPVVSAEPGKLDVTVRDTDTLEIRADVASPCMVVVSNAYCRDWHARPLGSSATQQYVVQPVNWAFQGVALDRGSHQFVLEYRPGAFVVGRAISIASLLTSGALVWFLGFKRRVS